ncbi:MAG: hypothetical protein GQ532_03930 [Methylomarinum sp.]|nr:hypothetical protein [Methylomarinum sp.]
MAALITLEVLDKAAELILQRMASGQLVEGCSMSAVQTPVREAWDIAEQLTGQAVLDDVQRQRLLRNLEALAPAEYRQVQTTGSDDFDRVYAYLLALCNL